MQNDAGSWRDEKHDDSFFPTAMQCPLHERCKRRKVQSFERLPERLPRSLGDVVFDVSVRITHECGVVVTIDVPAGVIEQGR